MAESTKTRISTPPWAWAFVVICGAIPVIALGGAIPTVLGIGGAASCLKIARKPGRSAQNGILFCTILSIMCWGGFVGSAGVVASLMGADANGRQVANLSDETERREIYSTASRIVTRIEEATADREQSLSNGDHRGVRFAERQLTELEVMNRTHIKAVAGLYQITPLQIDAIFDEGDTAGWRR